MNSYWTDKIRCSITGEKLEKQHAYKTTDNKYVNNKYYAAASIKLKKGLLSSNEIKEAVAVLNKEQETIDQTIINIRKQHKITKEELHKTTKETIQEINEEAKKQYKKTLEGLTPEEHIELLSKYNKEINQENNKEPLDILGDTNTHTRRYILKEYYKVRQASIAPCIKNQLLHTS